MLSGHAPWATPRGIDPVLQRWLASSYVKPCLAADETLRARGAAYSPFPEGLSPALANALRERGIARLYAHQARAFEAARARRSYVVATPTASGKSLCFHLPVLQALLEDPDARAIYLFPTKALARDTEPGLRELRTASGVVTGA